MKVLVRSLAALVVGALLLVGMTPAHAAVATQAVFNNPTGTAAEQAAIVTKISGLIAGAPAGSRIRMSMYYADDPTIPNALIAAKSRGVNVQVIFSYKETGEALWPSLTAALGTDKTKSSYAITCPSGRGCIGNRTLSTVDSINHNKFFLF